MRLALGLVGGMPLTVTSDGVGIRIEPQTQGGRLIDVDGRLTVESAGGREISDAEVREAIDAGRR
jgi:hypothetical protein